MIFMVSFSGIGVLNSRIEHLEFYGMFMNFCTFALTCCTLIKFSFKVKKKDGGRFFVWMLILKFCASSYFGHPSGAEAGFLGGGIEVRVQCWGS